MAQVDLWNIFKYFDVDKKNKITVENLKEVMAREG
jgi:Ca2+-binding EF-hand superfamily protein